MTVQCEKTVQSFTAIYNFLHIKHIGNLTKTSA